MQTNTGKLFLNLIDEHFKKSHEFHKMYNRKCIKISYSSSPNIKALINSHNKIILNKPSINTDSCNCRKKTNSLFENKYLLTHKKHNYTAKIIPKMATPTFTLYPHIGLSKLGSMNIKTPPQKLTRPIYVTAPSCNNTKYKVSWKVIKSTNS